jgi:hypothetical protein
MKLTGASVGLVATMFIGGMVLLNLSIITPLTNGIALQSRLLLDAAAAPVIGEDEGKRLFDDRMAAFNYSHLSGRFQTCLAAAQPDERRRKAPFAVVQSRPASRSYSELDLSSSLMHCYARRHGGLAFTNVVNEDHFSQTFYTARWLMLRDRYWHEAEWVMGADGDILPVGFDNSIVDYLGRHPDADVLLNMRENGEVHASMVAFRTRSPFARCFIDAWIEWGDTNGRNMDNGDLLELTLQVLDPELYEKCHPLREPSYGDFVLCFTQLYPRIQGGQTRRVPLKVLWPFETFSRSLYREDEKCFHSDLFVHGLSIILPRDEYFDDYLYSCEKYPPDSLLPACYKKKYVNPEETLQYAMKCCYWHYPGCLVDGHNFCREQPHCEQSLGQYHGILTHGLYDGQLGTPGLCF